LTRIKPRDLGLLLLVTFFWGMNWTAVRIGLDGISPWALRTIGLSGGAILMIVIALGLGRSLRVPKTQWGTLAIAGLLNVAGFNIFVIFAQLNLPTSKAAILTFTMPFWAMLGSAWFLGETLDRRKWLSLAIGLSGLLVLAAPFWAMLMSGERPWGMIYVLGGALSWAAGSVFLKAVKIDADEFALSAWQLTVGALAAALGMSLFETINLNFDMPGVFPAMGFHILLPIAFCYTVWFGLVARLPVSTVTLATLIIPVFGVLGAVVFLGERLTSLDLAGFGLILAGLALNAMRSG
jgi:drug/metabolite transporter (DMT)-like permease